MKKILLAVFISLFSIAGYSNISEPDLFKLDEKSLDIEFAELNKLEDYVLLYQGITLTEILKSNKNIILPKSYIRIKTHFISWHCR